MSCCESISLESPFNFNNANGVYNFDAASGHYKHESEDIILYSHPNRLGYTGWFFAHNDMYHIEILNPVCIIVKIFNAYDLFNYQDYTVCPDMVEAGWKFWNGFSYTNYPASVEVACVALAERKML